MKILLINPNMLIHKDYPAKDLSFPLGLGYLAAVAENKGHQVQILDTLLEGFDQYRPFNDTFNEYGLSDEAVLDTVKVFDPDLIGIGCTFTSRWPIVKRLSSFIKRAFPEIPIVTGGIQPTNVPEDVIAHEGIDFVCIGEGELVFHDLLDALEGNLDFSEIPGLGFKQLGHVQINRQLRFVEDLDSIPMPARHLLPYEKYLKFNRNSVIATRGCPNRCVFCSMPAVMGNGYRTRSAQNFVDEIEHINATYGTRFFSFDDDNINLRKTFVLEFCDEILKRNMNIHWNTPNGVNINALDFHVLSKMKEAGCYALCLAIESGDPHILKQMNKKVSLKKVRDITGWCRELEIFTLGFFILGTPGETAASMEKTRKFALSLALDAINVSIITPFPGTSFFNECVNKGYLKDIHHDRLNIHESNISTPWLIASAVKNFQKAFLRDFSATKHSLFTMDVLTHAVRNPQSESQLKKLQDAYFHTHLKSKKKAHPIMMAAAAC